MNNFQESTTAQSGTVNPVSQSLFAGRTINGGVSQGYLSGAPDELRVYGRALSAAEVQDLYANNTPTVFSTFTYDGDGNRVKKVESGQTTVYPNRYYEKNVTTGEITTSYYHGGTLVALRKGAALEYVHQDHLSGTSVSTDATGAQKSSLKYLPYGETLTGTGALGTDREFTGQRLDGTGLYFYNARYYDPTIGRFVSADTVVPYANDPQAFNRYSYVLNDPLVYTDPTGNCCFKHLKNFARGVARGLKNNTVGAVKATVDLATNPKAAVQAATHPVETAKAFAASYTQGGAEQGAGQGLVDAVFTLLPFTKVGEVARVVKLADEVADAGSGVWKLKPLERGKVIDTADLGVGHGPRNVVSNQPIIDRVEGETLISRKSLDPTAPSYQNPSRLEGRITGYIDDVADFQDRVRLPGREGVPSSGYSRGLELVIPEGTGLPDSVFGAVSDYAAQRDVDFFLINYGR